MKKRPSAEELIAEARQIAMLPSDNWDPPKVAARLFALAAQLERTREALQRLRLYFEDHPSSDADHETALFIIDGVFEGREGGSDE